MPGLPKISRPFLTAVSRVHSAKNTKQRKGPGKSRLFSTLKKEAKSWKNSRNFFFQLFLRLVRYKYYSRKLLQYISNTNPKNTRLFMRKKAPFSGFHDGEWKLKKSYPFFSFECEIQRNTLIFRHFSFSSSVFFAKSRIARSDHWLMGSYFQ